MTAHSSSIFWNLIHNFKVCVNKQKIDETPYNRVYCITSALWRKEIIFSLNKYNFPNFNFLLQVKVVRTEKINGHHECNEVPASFPNWTRLGLSLHPHIGMLVYSRKLLSNCFFTFCSILWHSFVLQGRKRKWEKQCIDSDRVRTGTSRPLLHHADHKAIESLSTPSHPPPLP